MITLADVFLQILENDSCQCQGCMLRREKSEKPIKQENKKESKQSCKDQLKKLLETADESELFSSDMPQVSFKDRFNAIEILLEQCQKPKELTLEEKLIADGWIKNEFVNYYSKDVFILMKSGNSWDIKINEPDKLWVTIPYIEDYEIIKKAVELVRSM